jgi:hypothetical protein
MVALSYLEGADSEWSQPWAASRPGCRVGIGGKVACGNNGEERYACAYSYV